MGVELAHLGRLKVRWKDIAQTPRAQIGIRDKIQETREFLYITVGTTGRSPLQGVCSPYERSD